MIVDQFVDAETAFGRRQFYTLNLRHYTPAPVADGAWAQWLERHAQTSHRRGHAVTRWRLSTDPRWPTIAVTWEDARRVWVAKPWWRSAVNASASLSTFEPSAPRLAAVGPTAATAYLKAALTFWLHACADDPFDWVQLTDPLGRFDRIPACAQPSAIDLHFFGSPLTAHGPTSFLESRFRQLQRTIHLEGPKSLSKHALIRRLGEIALMRGHSVEFYHDTLDPSLIDHLIVVDLALGITHQAAPHWLAPGASSEWYRSPTPLHLQAKDLESFQHAYQLAWSALSHQTVTKPNLRGRSGPAPSTEAYPTRSPAPHPPTSPTAVKLPGS